MISYCQIQVAGLTSGVSSNQVLDSLPRRENRRSSRSRGNTNLKEKQKLTRLRCNKWRKRTDYLRGAVGTFFHSSGN